MNDTIKSLYSKSISLLVHALDHKSITHFNESIAYLRETAEIAGKLKDYGLIGHLTYNYKAIYLKYDSNLNRFAGVIFKSSNAGEIIDTILETLGSNATALFQGVNIPLALQARIDSYHFKQEYCQGGARLHELTRVSARNENQFSLILYLDFLASTSDPSSNTRKARLCNALGHFEKDFPGLLLKALNRHQDMLLESLDSDDVVLAIPLNNLYRLHESGAKALVSEILARNAKLCHQPNTYCCCDNESPFLYHFAKQLGLSPTSISFLKADNSWDQSRDYTNEKNTTLFKLGGILTNDILPDKTAEELSYFISRFDKGYENTTRLLKEFRRRFAGKIPMNGHDALFNALAKQVAGLDGQNRYYALRNIKNEDIAIHNELIASPAFKSRNFLRELTL